MRYGAARGGCHCCSSAVSSCAPVSRTVDQGHTGRLDAGTTGHQDPSTVSSRVVRGCRTPSCAGRPAGATCPATAARPRRSRYPAPRWSATSPRSTSSEDSRAAAPRIPRRARRRRRDSWMVTVLGPVSAGDTGRGARRRPACPSARGLRGRGDRVAHRARGSVDEEAGDQQDHDQHGRLGERARTTRCAAERGRSRRSALPAGAAGAGSGSSRRCRRRQGDERP